MDKDKYEETLRKEIIKYKGKCELSLLGGNYYIYVNVGLKLKSKVNKSNRDNNLPGIVDTGAPHSFIRKEFLCDIDYEDAGITEAPVRILGINKHMKIISIKVVTINMELSIEHVKVAVIEDIGFRYDMILGCNILEYIGANINMETKHISFKKVFNYDASLHGRFACGIPPNISSKIVTKKKLFNLIQGNENLTESEILALQEFERYGGALWTGQSFLSNILNDVSIDTMVSLVNKGYIQSQDHKLFLSK